MNPHEYGHPAACSRLGTPIDMSIRPNPGEEAIPDLFGPVHNLDRVSVEIADHGNNFVLAFFQFALEEGRESLALSYWRPFVSLVILWPRTPNGARELVVPAPKDT
jgi:hypothetical protein